MVSKYVDELMFHSEEPDGTLRLQSNIVCELQSIQVNIIHRVGKANTHICPKLQVKFQ